MIKRYPTKCKACGHRNTLRVTLGVNTQQRHTFECQGCGEEAAIALEIDFENRDFLDVPGIGKMSFPRVTDAKLENAEWTSDEGTITNLDPTFLVPEEQLHVDRVFSWMGAIPAVINSRVKDGSRFSDITAESGMSRGLREGIACLLKAVDFAKRGRNDLVDAKLAELSSLSGYPVQNFSQAIGLIASAILGRSGADTIKPILSTAERAFDLDPKQFSDMRNKLLSDISPDFFERQIVVLKDYLRGYDQFSQAWFYASAGIKITSDLHPSIRSLDTIRHFYGTAFEQLSSALVLPACINNIIAGRRFDVFANIDLKKYITIDKARRAECIENRDEFSPLWNEFDSALRNGSYHQGLRLKANSRYTIQYRTGDSKAWQDIPYAEFLVRCNMIQFCLLRLLMLQLSVFGVPKFES